MTHKELSHIIFKRGKDKFEDMEVYIERSKNIEIGVYKGEIDKYNISDTVGLSFRGICGWKKWDIHILKRWTKVLWIC